MKSNMGLPLRLGRFKGWIHPEYNHPPFLEAISDCALLLEQPQSRILLDGRNRVGIVRIRHPEKGETVVVIKEFGTRGVNMLKSLFFPAKAFKAWRAAMMLVERGIDTPFPVACLEKRKGCFLDKSFYLAEKIDEVREIRSLFLDSAPKDLHLLLQSLASYLSLCHEKGVLHRDLSDGNILVKKDAERWYRFYFIDTNRIRFPRKMSRLKRIKNLIRLGIPPSYQSLFLEEYMGKESLNRFLWFWYRMNKIVYTGYVTLKRKLRIRQLANKLRIQ